MRPAHGASSRLVEPGIHRRRLLTSRAAVLADPRDNDRSIV
jgi:hypothetical protein